MAIGGARIELPSYASMFGGCVGSTIASGTCSSTNQSAWGGTINVIWSPFRALDVGLEYQHFERALQSAFSTGTNTATTGGVANRIQMSGIARF
jgi:hypothetical protein